MVENLYRGVGIDAIEVLYEGSERCMLFLVVDYKFLTVGKKSEVRLESLVSVECWGSYVVIVTDWF